ncbi:MAG: nucleotide exchange factor GrpE [Acholeplasmataceae bacterium]|jgi:molecular chaperone GrpE|nr:nucleotide exchange factor GrpE [Acholeplasmataceae bacterium]
MNNRYREEEKEEMENQNQEPVVEEVVEPENDDVSKLKEEVNRLNDLYLRTLAESENFRKRINEERNRERKYSAQSLMEKLIVTLDVFDKAVNIQTDDEKLKNFLIGFEMINRQLQQIIADEGVKKIEALNKKFDPNYHHAIETDYQEGVEEDIILQELQTGYMFKDRVLRPALVKVNKKNKEEK